MPAPCRALQASVPTCCQVSRGCCAWPHGKTEARGGGEVSQGSTLCGGGTVTPPFKASAKPAVSLLFFLASRHVLSSRHCLNLRRCQFHFAGLERTHRSFLACATFWLLDISTPSSPSPETPTQIVSAFTMCQKLRQPSLHPRHYCPHFTDEGLSALV